MSLWLNKLGAEVMGYALPPPTTPSLFQSANIDQLMYSYIGDIGDFPSLSNQLNTFKPEIVFHMAAQPLVRLSYKNPVETYMTNVMGTVHLLEAVRQCSSVKVAVNVTTDKCYENKEWHWGYRESEPMGGHDPYSSSKACSELVTSAYRRSYFTKENTASIASARAGNVIGGGDWAQDRLIPDIVTALTNSQIVKVRNPHSIRPWQHVLEPLSGYLVLAEKLYTSNPEFSEAFNFGPLETDAREVEWIVKKLTTLWGSEAKYIIEQDPNSPHEANYLKLDCSKAKNLLNWQPTWDLETTLESIVAWYRAYNQSPHSVRDVCLRQIEDFERTMHSGT